jgi:glucosamine 6-phosphate synthetase-like amidotransferase/phosphosugar isomerase protein
VRVIGGCYKELVNSKDCGEINKNMESEIRVASNLSSEVQRAIEQVLESDDPLTKPDFNGTDYINSLFPTEQSLNSNNTIDDVIMKMQVEIQVIDENIRDVVRGVSTSGNEGKQALDEAKKTIQQLFTQISDIKTRAEVTEDVVKSITSDIKQLDCAKKNLTSAITTLNHLHMLVGGVEKLKALTQKRQYGEISNPLQAITEVNEHFKQYKEIPQIKELSVTVAEIHKQLAVQITEDFKNTFSLTPNNSSKMSISQLKNACLVISVLDIKVRRELIKWFISE